MFSQTQPDHHFTHSTQACPSLRLSQCHPQHRVGEPLTDIFGFDLKKQYRVLRKKRKKAELLSNQLQDADETSESIQFPS